MKVGNRIIVVNTNSADYYNGIRRGDTGIVVFRCGYLCSVRLDEIKKELCPKNTYVFFNSDIEVI